MNRALFFFLTCLFALTVNAQGKRQYVGYKFIENKGQWEDHVKYRADLKAGHLYVEEEGLLLLREFVVHLAEESAGFA